MAKFRVPIFLLIVFSIFAATWILIQIGNGYRPNINNGSIEITNTGLLVANSEPQGGQVFINNELTTATDDTVSLNPNEYDIEIKKDGYVPWRKKLSIEPAVVIQTNATLFPIVPDLKAITYTGVINSKLSPNGTRIIYAVDEKISTPSSTFTDTKSGLWILELSDLPLGFSRDPRQIVTGNTQIPWQDCQFEWSYDSRQVLAICQQQLEPTPSPTRNRPSPTPSPTIYSYLIDISQLQKSDTLVNLSSNYQKIITEWNQEQYLKLSQQLSSLKPDLEELLSTVAAEIKFSPDETKLMYIATASAELKPTYIPPLLAASSQPQTRSLSPNQLFIYDTKEDRNFLIDPNYPPANKRTTKYQWYPSSRHLIKSTPDQVSILEMDNTNQAIVYSGNVGALDVFPHPSGSKLVVVTSLNPAQSPVPNLYTLIFR